MYIMKTVISVSSWSSAPLGNSGSHCRTYASALFHLRGKGPGISIYPIAGKLSGKVMQALTEVWKSGEVLWRVKARG